MIDSKKELKECLEIEEQLYREIGYKGKLHSLITCCEVGKLFQFITALRMDEYYSNCFDKSIVNRVKSIYFRRKHNKLGIKLGISIPINTFGKGLLIYHSQSIIVHRNSRCGEFCKLHGMNCIGNSGGRKTSSQKPPQVGNYLDLGVGGSIIGDIEIADYTTVAANAVVCKSVFENNQVLAGVPAKTIKVG